MKAVQRRRTVANGARKYEGTLYYGWQPHPPSALMESKPLPWCFTVKNADHEVNVASGKLKGFELVMHRGSRVTLVGNVRHPSRVIPWATRVVRPAGGKQGVMLQPVR